jgi:hypothetical protein
MRKGQFKVLTKRILAVITILLFCFSLAAAATFNGNDIEDLDITTPDGAVDAPSTLDNSDREIKRVLVNQFSIAAKTSAYTLASTDTIITCDAAGGGFKLTLPAVAGVSSATKIKEYVVQKTDSGAGGCEIDGDGSETINGVANLVLGNQWDTAWLVGNGTSWMRLLSLDTNDATTLNGNDYIVTSAGTTFTGKTIATGATQLVSKSVTTTANDVLLVEWAMRCTPAVGSQSMEVTLSDTGGGTPWQTTANVGFANQVIWSGHSADTNAKYFRGEAVWIPAGGTDTLKMSALVNTSTCGSASGELSTMFLEQQQ